jgi:UDP-N-acetylmuramoyl-tripeptide--D-alanyl-D-alanine ligase
MAGWSYTLNELARIIGAEPVRSEAAFSAVSTDTRKLRPGGVFFALSGPNFDGNSFVPDAFRKGAVGAVTKTRNVAGPCLIVEDPLKALQQFAAQHRARYRIPVFALTGSCGKTSTKDMTAQVLATRYNVVKTQGNLNNEIGCPLSLLQLDQDTDIAVIEMGANHKGEIAGLCALARPTESAITIIAPAHLDGFGNIENVAKAKAEIVESLNPDGTFYVNVDDIWCVRIAEFFEGRKVRFGSGGDVTLKACRMLAPGEMELDIAPVGTLRLPLACRGHAGNVLLALAVGLEHGVDTFEGPLREACAASSRFHVLTIGPLTVIDDTYNANPASMSASLEALAEWPSEGARIAALGEMLELGDAAASLHHDIGTKAGRVGVSHLFAKGPHACDTIQAARTADVPHAEAIDDPRELAQAIQRIARPGDLLLVKGSRGMRMERVVQVLEELYS